MAELTLQYIVTDLVPTYTSVTSNDWLTITGSSFLHFLNASAYNDIIIISRTTADSDGNYHCYVKEIPANDELLIGPFDFEKYGPAIGIHHSVTTGVSVAALAELPTTINIIEEYLDTIDLTDEYLDTIDLTEEYLDTIDLTEAY